MTDLADAWGGTNATLLHERENAVYQMTLPDGRPAALRRHRPGYQSRETILAELTWTAALSEAGFPCPAPIPTLSGAPLDVRDDTCITAVTWVPGDPFGSVASPPDAEAFNALGALLAKLHTMTDALDLGPLARPAWDLPGFLGETPLWGRFWEHPVLSGSEAANLSDLRETLLTDARTAFSRDVGLIHADALQENVLTDAGTLSLIDFDDSGTGPRAYDLATALIQQVDRPDLGTLAAALLDGYAAHRGDREHLGRDVPMLVMMRSLASLGWSQPRYARDHPRHRIAANRALELATLFRSDRFPLD